MEICVFGTSNSILKFGYTLPIRSSPFVTRYHSACMGKSVSLLSEETGAGLDLSNFKYCFLDFAVNEAVFLRRGLSPSRIADHTRSLIGRCWVANCLPVILIFPRKDSTASNSQIRDLYLGIADELNLPYFDVISLIDKIGSPELGRDALFRDSGHLREWIAIAAGQKLLTALRQIPPAQREASAWTFKNYDAIACVRGGPSELHVARINSLYEAVLYKLEAGTENDTTEINVPAGARVVGICSNLGSTYGLVEISGDRTELLDLRNGYQTSGQDFVLSTLALPRPVVASAGTIRLRSVAPTADVLESLPADAFPLREGPSRLGAACAEIKSIIVELPSTTEMSTRPARALHVD